MAPAGQLVVPVDQGKTAADQLVPLAPAVEVKVPAEQMELESSVAAAAVEAREAAGREAKKPEDQAAEETPVPVG